MNKIDKITTRIAPSPTGKLHIGTARTALFNYLFAKQNNGKFIIRIEDTDIERSKVEFEKDIFDGLEWLGLSYFNTKIYRQSERFNIYEKYIDKLLKLDLAYKCFCTIEELNREKDEQKAKGLAPIYSGKCSKLRKEKKLDYVIRFRANNCKGCTDELVFYDIIRGKITTKINLIGDFVIAKVKIGKISPLYNFVVVVDDYEMNISHIIRGEDHIPNTPKQILIQKALNFHTPKYVHLPLILGTDKSKMSKRTGATSIISYKEDGYLPEALINFMAFLGWSPKNEREFFTLEDLIKVFSIKKIQKSGAIFNIEKLDYINGYYIRKKTISELTKLCIPYLIKSELITLFDDKKEKAKTIEKYKINKTGKIVDIKYIEKIVKSYQERLKKLSEIAELGDYFFLDKLSYQKEMFVWEKMNYEDIIKSLKFTRATICDKIKEEEFNQSNIKREIFSIVPSFNESIGLIDQALNNKGYLLWPFRVAMTAKKASSGPFEIAEILGKEKTIQKIDIAINFLLNNY